MAEVTLKRKGSFIHAALGNRIFKKGEVHTIPDEMVHHLETAVPGAFAIHYPIAAKAEAAPAVQSIAKGGVKINRKMAAVPSAEEEAQEAAETAERARLADQEGAVEI